MTPMRRGTIGLCAMLAVACGDDGGPTSDTEGASTSSGSTGASGSTSVATNTSETGEPATSSTSGVDSTGVADSGDSGSSSGGPAVSIDDPLRLVFVADDAVGDIDELWYLDEADYAAGAIRVNQELIGPRLISPTVRVTDDGGWLLYRTVRLAPGAEHELWVADMSGGAPAAGVRVDDTPELVHEYDFVGAQPRVVWIGPSGVYAVDLSGGTPSAPQALTPAPTGGGAYVLYELGQSDGRIYYTADPDGTGVENLYAVPADGSAAPTLLSDLSVPMTSVDGNTLFPDPGGAWVVYAADRDVPEPEMFWVDLAAPGVATKINDPVTTESIRTERLSPSGAFLAYFAGELGTPDLGDVFVVPIDAAGPGAPIAVHTAMTGLPQAGRIAFSPDESWLQYTADEGGNLQSWVISLDGGVPGTPMLVSGTVPADGDDVVTHLFSPDSNSVVYIADSDGPVDLYWVDLSSGAPGPIQRLVDPAPTGSGLTGDVAFSPDGTQLLFTGFVTSIETRDVYTIDLAAGPPWTTEKVNPTLLPNEEVGVTPRFAGEGTHVLYVGPGPDRGDRQLFDPPPGGEGFDEVVPISGSGFVKSFRALP